MSTKTQLSAAESTQASLATLFVFPHGAGKLYNDYEFDCVGLAMHLGKLGQQFVLKSERAFDRLRFTGYEEASRDEWYERKMSRDRAARREYLDEERSRRQPGDLFIATIMDERMGALDERLR